MPDVAPAELIITNAVVRTLDDATPEASAFAVRRGRIIAVGTADEVAAHRGPDTRTVDLGGRVVMPGLMDVHNHHSLAGLEELFEFSFSSSADLDTILAAVREHAATLPEGAWIHGGNWGSPLMAELATPETLARFDEASLGHPVLLKDDSHHNRWGNSEALRLAGVTADTPDPEGGAFLRDAEGRPTGVLIEAAGVMVDKARRAAGDLTPEQYAEASAHAIAMLHSFGITAFQDAAATEEVMRGLKTLDDRGDLKAWVVTSALINDFVFGADPIGSELLDRREAYRSEHHRPDFAKIFLDGVPPARTGAFLEPYVPDEVHGAHHCGHTTMPADQLERWLRRAAQDDVNVKIHCTGDASVRMVLDAVAALRADGIDHTRYHIAHGQFVHPDDRPRFAELGVHADISPTLWFPGVIIDAIQSVLPEPRASQIQAVRSLIAVGANVAGGSDWPVVESPNPWPAIYGLVTRQDPSGQAPGTLWAEEAVDVETALRIYTTNSARAMGLDDVAGRITVGRSADFVVLDRDPFSCPVADIPGVRALETWFAGERVYAADAS